MYEDGHSREYIQEKVIQHLMDNAWVDYDCGEVFDSETIDTDFDCDTDDDESVYSVADVLVSSFYYEEENNTDDREQIHLGGLEDD